MNRHSDRTALVYNPGLHVLGGGERYTFALVDALAGDWRVRLAGTAIPPTDELARHGFATDVDVLALPYREFPVESAGYDLAITVTIYPPSYPSRARRSSMAVSFPFRAPLGWRHPRASIRERRALHSYDNFIANSAFTQRWLAQRWNRPSEILYPPVALGSYDRARKKHVILSIARFIPEKGHAVLVDAFTALPPELTASWTLVLVGGSTDSPAERQHLDALRTRSAGHRIEIHENASQAEVHECLETASIFWHAAGYGRLEDHPEDAEHFGISIVEAMSYGAVPLVYADGGPREFIDGRNGTLWATVEELVAHSVEIMSDDELRAARARQAVSDSQRFSTDAFRASVRRLFP
jgi:glycosyltransferase involved in cell wall biosynthesis